MSVWIRIGSDAATVSADAPVRAGAAFATALVEARGALLIWSVPPRRFPDAEVHAPVEAAAWLADVYGPEIADAVRQVAAGLPGATASRQEDALERDALERTVPLPADADLVDAARRLALLTWARVWWPAGLRVPALDPGVLAAETAIATHALEHLLDDDEAVERALEDAADAASALAAVPVAFADDAAALDAALSAIAEDYGVELSPVRALPDAAEWALAAGGTAPSTGVVLAEGRAAVRWTDVLPGTVTADAEATWAVLAVGGSAVLRVGVAGVRPGAVPPPASLRARFGPDPLDIDVPLEPEEGGYAGSVAVPASVALLPLDERTLHVRDIRVAPGAGGTPAEVAAVLTYAAVRVEAPGAGLAERIAGAGA